MNQGSTPQGRRYDAKIMSRARELRAGGWAIAGIADILSRELGVQVAKSTVHVWVDEEQHRRHMERSRRGHRRRDTARMSGSLGSSHHSPEFRLRRAGALRGLGLDQATVAALMAFDYGHALPKAVSTAGTVEKFKRLQELRPLPGMSFTAIASVMSLEYGEPVEPERLRYALRIGRWPRERKTLTVAA